MRALGIGATSRAQSPQARSFAAAYSGPKVTSASGKCDKKVLRKQYADGELDVEELAPPAS